jgi:hypothetical protein
MMRSIVLSLFKDPMMKRRRSSVVRRRCGEEAEKVGEEEEADEAELERVLRQTRRSHVVTPPIALAREEDRVLIRPLGDR